jgi:hypothetical protein
VCTVIDGGSNVATRVPTAANAPSSQSRPTRSTILSCRYAPARAALPHMLRMACVWCVGAPPLPPTAPTSTLVRTLFQNTRRVFERTLLDPHPS